MAHFITSIIVILAIVCSHRAHWVTSSDDDVDNLLELSSISKIRFEVRKLNLAREAECRLFAERICQVVSQSQTGDSETTNEKNVLRKLAKMVEGRPSWSTGGGGQTGRSLLDYINQCSLLIDGPDSSGTCRVTSQTTNTWSPSVPESKSQQVELEMLKQKVARLEATNRQQSEENKRLQEKIVDLEVSLRKANDLSVEYQHHLETNVKQSQEKLTACETDRKDFISATHSCNRELASCQEKQKASELDASRQEFIMMEITRLQSKYNANLAEFRNCRQDLELLRSQKSDLSRRSNVERDLASKYEKCHLELMQATECKFREANLKRSLETATKSQRDCEDRLKTLSSSSSSSSSRSSSSSSFEIPVEFINNNRPRWSNSRQVDDNYPQFRYYTQ